MVADPLFTILMPTHERVDVIGLAVQSILDQTVQDFELLVVGDGCAAGTEAVLLGFNDPRIRFFDLPKAPFFGYANRNLALRQSRGKYIAFMADDDLVLPDHLAILQQGLAGGAALAYSQAIWVSEDGIAAPFLTNLEFADELAGFMQGNSIPASCFAYRADILPQRDVWPENVPAAADWKLWHRIIANAPASPVKYCRLATVLHFSARRKQSRHSNSPDLQTYLDIADHADWWPSSLRPQLVPGQSEQSAYAAFLQQNPVVACATLRADISDVICKIAWQDIRQLRPELASTSRRLDEALLDRQDCAAQAEATTHALAECRAMIAGQLHDLTGLMQEKAELAQQLAALAGEIARNEMTIAAHQAEARALRQSTSWRVTRPLRALRRLFRH